MRDVIRAILKVLGLSTRREVEHLSAQAKARDRELEESRTSLKAARQQQQDLGARATQLHQAVESLKQDVQRWKDQADANRIKHEAAVEAERRATARSDELAVAARDLRVRLETAETSLTVTRDHLMATETKLDLVEAAINLLDQRTREQLDTRPQLPR